MRELMVVVFLVFLLWTAAADWKTMEIPDEIPVLFLILSLISMKIIPELSILERLLGGVSASLILLVTALLIPGAFGGGDIKLMAACGLFLGWRKSLLALYLAVLIGGSCGGILLFTGRKKRTDHFAFGPFLCLGMTISLFWEDEILRWYLSVCGIES